MAGPIISSPEPTRPHTLEIVTQSPPQTVDELCDRIQTWADGYYRKLNGELTGESHQIRYALQHLKQVVGSHPITAIDGDALCECQDLMIRSGLSRRTINQRMNKLRRCIRWAARPPRRWVSAQVVGELALVENLKRGRTRAIERGPVPPVAWRDVLATIAHAPPALATMIQVQWWSGMRPGELIAMRKRLIRQEDDLLVYRPEHHKMTYLDKPRVIFMGPKCQRILWPWIDNCKGDRLWPHRSRPTYYNALRRVNEMEGLKHWTPNQLRHSAATRVRAEAGLDAAQGMLGHTKSTMTEHYAEVPIAAAMAAVRRLG